MILTPQVIPEVIPDVRWFHMFVVGMMLALAPHPAKRRASRFRIERSPKDQWGALADAGRIDASQLSQTF
jgi:hypothetical protein